MFDLTPWQTSAVKRNTDVRWYKEIRKYVDQTTEKRKIEKASCGFVVPHNQI
ncbi:hypothetical protein, unlikely [Trypanosoma brucei brucei TREU927]|uniref:Uncharacterized protein n=1 Tax=Trypanosoma brucei brucei (strain 927/4 GUTat10.1) TaxID=185431 RepID=Q38ED6_TRYB2|nr:hypothetical protein, unlikely [Trypanosoma brucei brucei TREU927]EAN76834.1 hypothetical protein, unlikely [Trypanosoma brucei brucei TREU927]